MINELAGGVSRLKDQTIMINDEACHQNKLLDSVSFCMVLFSFELPLQVLK